MSRGSREAVHAMEPGLFRFELVLTQERPRAEVLVRIAATRPARAIGRVSTQCWSLVEQMRRLLQDLVGAATGRATVERNGFTATCFDAHVVPASGEVTVTARLAPLRSGGSEAGDGGCVRDLRARLLALGLTEARV